MMNTGFPCDVRYDAWRDKKLFSLTCIYTVNTYFLIKYVIGNPYQ